MPSGTAIPPTGHRSSRRARPYASRVARLSPSWYFSVLSAALACGYGVLFTIVGDFRDEYGISETAIGVLIGSGFLTAFVAQILIAPVADRGQARRLIFAGVTANVAGLLLMAFGTSLTPLLVGRLISGLGIGAASERRAAARPGGR